MKIRAYRDIFMACFICFENHFALLITKRDTWRRVLANYFRGNFWWSRITPSCMAEATSSPCWLKNWPFTSPRPPLALVLSMSYKIHSSILNGRWNHMEWSIVATCMSFCRKLRPCGNNAVGRNVKSDAYDNRYLCTLGSSGSWPLDRIQTCRLVSIFFGLNGLFTCTWRISIGFSQVTIWCKWLGILSRFCW